MVEGKRRFGGGGTRSLTFYRAHEILQFILKRTAKMFILTSKITKFFSGGDFAPTGSYHYALLTFSIKKLVKKGEILSENRKKLSAVGGFAPRSPLPGFLPQTFTFFRTKIKISSALV